MQTLGPGNDRAANLYWLAFLLTGHPERSLDLAIDALDFHDGANLFFFELDACVVAQTGHRQSLGCHSK